MDYLYDLCFLLLLVIGLSFLLVILDMGSKSLFLPFHFVPIAKNVNI